MFKNENLIKLQEKLKKDGIEAYLILLSDPHDNEYVAKFYMDERLYFCPFSGDTGDLLVTQDSAYLFTDGRFFVQAEKELKGTKINLMKIGEKGVLPMNEFIKNNNLYPLGVNTSIISENLYESFLKKGEKILNKDYSYMIENKEALSDAKVFKLSADLVSLTYQEKIEKILEEVERKSAKANLITTLDDIAWILNLRGLDIPCNPVFYSYLYLSKDYGNHLFINKNKIDFVLEGIEIHEYEDIFEFIKNHDNVPTLIDKSRINARLFSLLKKPVNAKNPSYLMKCIKGDKEIENTKKIQVLDGVAMVKFGYFLKNNLDKNLSEFEYSEELEKFRRENKLLFELSFPTITAVGKNAAEMHYSPTKKVNSLVTKNDTQLLVDSGGQYFGGTTDTTRTYALNPNINDEFKHDYTLTLKSLIALTTSIFIEHSCGITLDIKAREIMWKEGLDYKCGTGHGVGYILNVHEGPNGFRYRHVPERDDAAELVPGMITTVEPGVYKENKYGIRIENNLLCVKAFETAMGNFFKFETITYVPIDTKPLDLSLMSYEEISWLNLYHETCYEKLSPFFIDNKELLEYLKDVTKEVKR